MCVVETPAHLSMSQPLDVTKTRLQLDKTGRYRGMVDCGVKTYQREGAAALYKGLTPFTMHLTLKYALRFATFSFFQKLLGPSQKAGSKADSAKTFAVRGARARRRGPHSGCWLTDECVST